MSEVYILQNQARLFLGKQKDWLDGRDPGSLYKTPHKDEAINLMFEVSSKDYTQRIHAVSCGVSEKGLPVIPEDIMPEAGSGAPAVKDTPITATPEADADTPLPDDPSSSEDTPETEVALETPEDDHPQGSLL